MLNEYQSRLLRAKPWLGSVVMYEERPNLFDHDVRDSDLKWLVPLFIGLLTAGYGFIIIIPMWIVMVVIRVRKQIAFGRLLRTIENTSNDGRRFRQHCQQYEELQRRGDMEAARAIEPSLRRLWGQAVSSSNLSDQLYA